MLVRLANRWTDNHDTNMCLIERHSITRLKFQDFCISTFCVVTDDINPKSKKKHKIFIWGDADVNYNKSAYFTLKSMQNVKRSTFCVV